MVDPNDMNKNEYKASGIIPLIYNSTTRGYDLLICSEVKGSEMNIYNVIGGNLNSFRMKCTNRDSEDRMRLKDLVKANFKKEDGVLRYEFTDHAAFVNFESYEKLRKAKKDIEYLNVYTETDNNVEMLKDEERVADKISADTANRTFKLKTKLDICDVNINTTHYYMPT